MLIEKERLRLLLHGSQSVLICLSLGIENMRISRRLVFRQCSISLSLVK